MAAVEPVGSVEPMESMAPVEHAEPAKRVEPVASTASATAGFPGAVVISLPSRSAGVAPAAGTPAAPIRNRARQTAHPGRRSWLWAGWVGALAVPLLSGPALAGSATADSVWDRDNAKQRAMQQVPAGATVTSTRCEDFSVGMDNTRYRCTVEFTVPDPAAPTSSTPAPGSPSSP
jgi:hypothetical protein